MQIYRQNELKKLLELLSERAENISPEIMKTVSDVITDVRKNGDRALHEYTEKFDKVKLESLFVSEEEQERLIEKVPDDLKDCRIP